MTLAVLLAPPNTVASVYANGRTDEIAEFTTLASTVIDPANLDQHADLMREVEIIFSTWGMPQLTSAQLDDMPKLRAVFYAAGSVANFARPFLERSIVVMSGWRANGVPVAEYTLSQILLACKGHHRNRREYKGGIAYRDASRGPGIYGETVALLGMGTIGHSLYELLKTFNLKVVAFDPFLPEYRAAEMGIEKVSLEEAFKRAFVVSNHLANKPETVGMLHAELFRSMRQGATFINTGRGATVSEPDLIKVMTDRPDLTALLDVTDPEPVRPGSPLLTLPNIEITTHIAGSMGDEVVRLADYCIADCRRFLAGEPMHHSVSLEMLATMA